ncbi:leucyl aminopeptidase [Micromonospora sp. STR1s_5]|nr:leucyl aminopeptidase [Micromonospora sp. STR1s_5]
MLAIRLIAEPDRLDVLVLPVRSADSTAEGDTSVEPVPTAVAGPDGTDDEAAALASVARLTGRAGEIHTQLRPGRTPGRLLLLGIGDGGEAAWRTAGAAVARSASAETHITIALPAEVTPAAVRGLTEGLLLAPYRFRLTEAGDRPALTDVDLLLDDPTGYEDIVAAARTTAAMTHLARDLTNTPSSVKTPQWFADQVASAAAELPDLRLRVRGPAELATEGFGGILAVGGGSASGPRLVELDWHPANARTHVVLIGKGITFDTGGISIKPAQGMWEMKSDMAGAAAVGAAMLAIAALKPTVAVSAYLPMAENMPSGTSYRPGDVITMFNGKRVEVLNTDAEGRMILGDAIARACADGTDYLFETSTLTGGQVIALGKRMAGVMGTPQLCDRVKLAGDAVGEPAWPMPLPDDVRKGMESDVADISQVNAGMDRAGHMLQGGVFLREFVTDDVAWAHIDIAGPGYHSGEPTGYLTKGGTGVPVRTLVQLVEDVAANG